VTLRGDEHRRGKISGWNNIEIDNGENGSHNLADLQAIITISGGQMNEKGVTEDEPADFFARITQRSAWTLGIPRSLRSHSCRRCLGLP